MPASLKNSEFEINARDFDILQPFAFRPRPWHLGGEVRYGLRHLVRGVPGIALLILATIIGMYPPLDGLPLAVLLGALYLLGIGLTVGFPWWWHMKGGRPRLELSPPADLRRVVDPDSTLRSDRTAALVGAGALGLLSMLFYIVNLDFAVMFALFWGIGWFMATTYARFVLARTVLALRGRLPWRTMTFLRDARRRGVLRQEGTVYKFRHQRLWDQLADAPEPRR